MSENAKVISSAHTFNMTLIKYFLLAPISSILMVSLFMLLVEKQSLGGVVSGVFLFGWFPWAMAAVFVASFTSNYLKTPIVVLGGGGCVASAGFLIELWMLHGKRDSELLTLGTLIAVFLMGFVPSLGFGMYQTYKRRIVK